MKLTDVIAHLDKLDDELFIFIEHKDFPDSDVVLLEFDDEGEVVRQHQGKTYHYLAEVIWAKKLVAEWKETLGREPSLNETAEWLHERVSD